MRMSDRNNEKKRHSTQAICSMVVCSLVYNNFKFLITFSYTHDFPAGLVFAFQVVHFDVFW